MHLVVFCGGGRVDTGIFEAGAFGSRAAGIGEALTESEATSCGGTAASCGVSVASWGVVGTNLCLWRLLWRTGLSWGRRVSCKSRWRRTFTASKFSISSSSCRSTRSKSGTTGGAFVVWEGSALTCVWFYFDYIAFCTKILHGFARSCWISGCRIQTDIDRLQFWRKCKHALEVFKQAQCIPWTLTTNSCRVSSRKGYKRWKNVNFVEMPKKLAMYLPEVLMVRTADNVGL